MSDRRANDISQDSSMIFEKLPREQWRIILECSAGVGFADFLLYLSVIMAVVAFALPEFFVDTKKASEAERAIVESDLKLIGEAILLLEEDVDVLAGVPGPNPCVNEPEVSVVEGDCQLGLYCTNGEYLNWKGHYLKKPLVDPWGQPYYLDNDYKGKSKMQRVVGSMGPNGLQDFHGKGDDLIVVLCERGS